jgi:signal transduction histidine kinase/CheY-like chemotaxis protein
MGAMMRATDWSKTKFGPVENWPKSLRTMLGVVLGSRFPMLLWWGPELLHLYNDAYRPILRDKHPASLAAPAAEVWAEVWDVAGPMARSVQEGGPATWTEDLQLFINSGGMAEETYFTFSYSPVPGDDGQIGGILNTVQETTAKVQSERQIRMLHDLAARAAHAKFEDEAYRIALEVLSANELDLPFVLLYLLDGEADDARLLGGSGLKDYQGPAKPAHVSIAGDVNAAHWPFAKVMRTSHELVIDDLSGRFGPLPVGRWNARPERAIILPLSRAGQSTPSAFLVAGVSPHRPLDDRYRRFFRLTADQMMTVVANTRVHEAEKKRSEALAQIDRAKTAFLANMSHELRTPLNAILGFSELLIDGQVPQGSPESREFLGDILKSGRHLLQLINDVLDLSKVEAGKLDFRPEPIDLESIILEVQSIVRTISVTKNVRINASVDPELKQGIMLDPARLKQVLYNFISNALKFTPRGGTVTVRALPHGAESLLLEVEDTGPGIAPEDVERLFVEFQQLEAGTAKEHSGTGLGLALTRRLAQAQGGSAGVRSTLGKGSVFYVVLPRRRPAAAAQSQFQPRPAAPDAPSVLVIEDDPRDQAQLVEALSAAGYAVDAASTGSQALALCGARKFDAICLDLLLPDMSGQDVLQRVRAGGPNRDVPVVVVTIVAEKGAVAGFTVQDFLPKPIDSNALLSSLARAGIRPDQSGGVLVVDDDAASLRLMAAALTQLGFRTASTQSAEEALRATANSPPAAIVLDLLMPGMDGFEFLDRLRDSPATRHTPVLIWSVKDLSSQEQGRLSRSAQAIVRKGHGGITALLEDLRQSLPARPRALTAT